MRYTLMIHLRETSPHLGFHFTQPGTHLPGYAPAHTTVSPICVDVSVCVSVRAEEASRKAAAATASSHAKNGKAQSSTAAPDPDPFGEAFLTKEPLTEATRFLAFLQLHSATLIETPTLAIEVQLRKAKWLLAWKAIKQLRSLQPHNPDLHFGLMRWVEGVQGSTAEGADQQQPLPSLIRQLLEEEWTEAGYVGPIADVNIAQLNEEVLRTHTDSLDHRFAGPSTPTLHTLHSTHPRPLHTRGWSGGVDERFIPSVWERERLSKSNSAQ